MKALRTTVIVIIILALVLGAAACSPSPDAALKDKGSEELSEEHTAIPASTQGAEVVLPDRNFDGYTFNILALDESVPYTYFEAVEGETGEVMNDAIYSRNLYVEEKYNIKLNVIKNIGTSGVYDKVNASVKAGDNAYDMVNPHIISDVSKLVSSGLLYDWNKLPYVDFSNPWWNKSMGDTIEVDGKLFIAAGDMIVPNVRVLCFNKQMISDFGMESPYDVVKSGKWTFDKLSEYIKNVSKDLNGDGVYGEEDQYGIGSLDSALVSLIHSSGQLVVELDDKGYPRSTLNSEKMLSVFEKIYGLIYTGNQCVQSSGYKKEILMDSGRVLFIQNVLLKIQGLRSSEVAFGIVPLPKFDDTQESYYSTVWNGLMGIPVTVRDAERTGIIMEALAAKSYEVLKPAYYETLLKGKFVRDDESSEMLDIIFDGLMYDFGLIFDEWCGNAWAIRTLMEKKSLDITSYWDKNSTKIEDHYDELYNAIKENG